MTIYVETETENVPDEYISISKDIAEFSADYLECPYECELEIIFTDDAGIRELNKEHRGLDKPTDVLSFPMQDYPAPCDFSLVEESISDSFNSETGEMLLGSIVISVERARAQAEEYGHSIKREIAFLTAHSMLHLFGYDHETDEERIVMEEIQEKILNEKGITRDYV